MLCTAFIYARYCKATQEITEFSMKDCLSLPGLGLKYLNSLRTKQDKPIYTHKDKYMRRFVHQAAYRGRVCAFIQKYKSKSCDNILKTISEKLNVKGKVYDIIDACIKYKNKHFKTFEKEYESNFDDYGDEDVEEKKFHQKTLGELPTLKILQQLSLNDLLW